MIYKKMIFIFFILLLLISVAFSQSPSELEEKLRNLGIDVPANTNLNQLMQKTREIVPTLDEAIIEAGLMGGIPIISTRPADTPEKEMQRRREIINSQYKSSKYMLGELSSQEKENPQIGEAIAVEGYIIVEGGERRLSYGQIERDIRYVIKEKFVGNLIVMKTYNIKTGTFEKEKEYELDTLSTDIKMVNFFGKQCTKWSYYVPKTCDRYANFILYEIDKSEFYPNFSSGVASISSINRNVLEIEANTPSVTLYGKEGLDKISTPISCTEGKWRLTSSEFEKLLNMGALTLRKDIGSKSQYQCLPGSTMTLHLKVKKEEPEICKESKDVKIEIIKPVHKSKYVFTDDGNTGRLILELEARTNSSQYEDRIEWEIPEMEGSSRIIQSNSGHNQPKGSKVEVMYKGLPPDVESFGRQKVKARIKVDNCIVEDTKEVMIFYPRDAKNNPEGKYPNWFYYWKQSPAARPFGQNVRIEFGGTEFDLCTGDHVMAIFKPDYLFKTIHICNLTEKADRDFKITIPLVSRSDRSTLTEKKLVDYTHIDTFAVIVMHEFAHFNHYHTWWSGKTREQREREDKDPNPNGGIGDGIPDRLEVDMGFDPVKFQTYWGEDEDFKNINGDEEFLAYESTYDYPIGKFDNYDWGKPGKNWTE